MTDSPSAAPGVSAPAADALVTAALPGLVVRLLTTDGATVQAGEALLVTETMKCEQTHTAPACGVARFEAAVGSIVEPGSVLVRLSPIATSTAAPSDPEPRAPRAARPPTPDSVIQLVCGPTADPSLGPVGASGTFAEYDLAEEPTIQPSAATGDTLVPAHPGRERVSGVVVGLMTHRLEAHRDGLTRVWIGGDSSKAMGAVSEAECRRIIAAFDLADDLGAPVEWVAVSAGARIAWDTGTETMDWCAAVVARIIKFTQAGGQVVVIVNGINVGAQSYWNAEATMLTHHRGMLVMVADHAMVLTGKRALALSGGGTHAEDAHIGGYHDVMGPNGQAHHQSATLLEAYRLVFTHHALCTPSTAGPLGMGSSDPANRDVGRDRYTEAEPFDTIGQILEAATHPGRKQTFAIRPVMGALVDRDAPILERWADMADARGAVTWDSRIAGRPVSLIGIESRPTLADTGDHWLSGATLHPEGSRKVAKAINAASGNRPCVVLANLAGFDGGARSMRGRQLEFGAEIARAVTNFEGDLVVVVLGRFHGGAYVVFSKALNNRVSIVAIDGTYVSVIGGDSAAGVVFASELKKRTAATVAAEPGCDPEEVHRSHRDALARRFDETHDVARAARVGSIDEVIAPAQMRPTVARLIGAGPCFPPQPSERRLAASASAAMR